jgi:hypothetical protein
MIRVSYWIKVTNEANCMIKELFITIASAYKLTIISTGKNIKCVDPKLQSACLVRTVCLHIGMSCRIIFLFENAYGE